MKTVQTNKSYNLYLYPFDHVKGRRPEMVVSNVSTVYKISR